MLVGIALIYFWRVPCGGAVHQHIAAISNLALNEAGLGARLLSLPAIVYVGRISCGLHLWHSAMSRLVVETRFDTPIWQLLIGGGGGLALAAISYQYFERPFLRLKRRLGPPRP